MWDRIGWAALIGAMMLIWPGAVVPAQAFCVENQNPERIFFVTEPADGTGLRRAFWLNMGEKICREPNAGSAKVYVYVYADEEDLEGCSRIITGDKTVRLDKMELYDRCAWTIMMRS